MSIDEFGQFRRSGDNEENKKPNLKIVFLIVAIFLLVILLFVKVLYKDNLYKDNFNQDEETPLQYEIIENETYYAKQDVLVTDSLPQITNRTIDQRQSLDNQVILHKYDTCNVIAFIDNSYYKVLMDNKEGYVKKDFLAKYTPLIKKQKERQEALAYFDRPWYTNKYTDGSIMEESGNGTYWGEADKKYQRHGFGTYQWCQRLTTTFDSIFIGQWDSGVMTGYGVMYYYKTGKHKNGIWRNNKLIRLFPRLEDKEVYNQLDSVRAIQMSMIAAGEE